MGRPLTNSRNSNPKFFDLSSRQCSFHADRWTSIVLIHYLCEPNYIIGELRVLASQVLFFLSKKRGRRKEDERGGIKKRQKRRKGTRKEKSSKNDRGTQTTLRKTPWIISYTKRQRQWIKKRSSKGEKAFREETSRKKTRRQCVVCQKE